MSDTTYLVCAPASERELLSEFMTPAETACSKCGVKLAIDSKNVPLLDRDGLKPICLNCYSLLEDREVGGCVIGGRYLDMAEALGHAGWLVRPRRLKG